VSRIVACLVLSCLLSALWFAPAAAVEANPFAGTWVLNVAKSKADEGLLPKSEIRTYAANIEGALTIVFEGVETDGMPYAYAATGDINGREYPVVGRDVGARILGDAISWRRIDPQPSK